MLTSLIVTFLVVIPAPTGATACSGARVEYTEVRDEATRIVVGTIEGLRGDPQAPDAIRLRVDALIRGSSPAVLVLDPPVYMGCEGLIVEPIGTRLVVATGRHFFDAAAPQDLHPYWIVGPDDVLDPAGIENADPTIRSLDDLVAAVGGQLVTRADAGPEAAAQAGAVTEEAGVWTIPAVLALVAVAAILGAVAIGGFRVIRRRRGA